MFRKHQAHGILLSFFFLFSPLTAVSEELRDYYAEPGLNPFKEDLIDLNESIDAFSGTLQHKYVDMLVPGNGGLDIVINRVYTSLQDESFDYVHKYTGLGWTMHMGRLVVPNSQANKICSQQLWSVTTLDNPSIEYPDGGREVLVLKDINVDETLITKSHWKADCGDVSQGMRVTAPDGRIHYMDEEEVYGGGTRSWLTSRIVDLNGNWININYGSGFLGTKYIDTITSSDGRLVTFVYENADTNAIQLKRIVANGQVVQYEYTPSDATGYQNLTKVIRQDGLIWQYTYNPQMDATEGGSYSLISVTYPHGGLVQYDYQLVRFGGPGTFNTTAIKTKTTSGPGITGGTWTYQFTPSTGSGVLDKTSIIAPDGSETRYTHQGFKTGALWAVGLLVTKFNYATDGDTLEVSTNFWNSRILSTENYSHGRGLLDSSTKAPILEERYHYRYHFSTGISFSNFDDFGNPQRTIEGCSLSACNSKTTDTTYLNDTDKWIIGRIQNETIASIGAVTRTFWSTGRLKTDDTYGVPSSFEYTSVGDLSKTTDARNYKTTYSNYYRGVARMEVAEVSATNNIITERTVNSTGTVASIKDGRGITTSFTYDGLNRLKTIDFPIGEDVIITYGLRSRILTRGNYQETTLLNGFGKPVSFERKDISTGETITTTTSYDEFGRTTFVSYPNSLLGTTTEYDGIGSVTKVTHGDGTFRSYEYSDFVIYEFDTKIIDERQKVTYTLSQYMGSFDNNIGVVNTSTGSIYTTLNRSVIGEVLDITQGKPNGFQSTVTYPITNAVTRSYTYDNHRFLETINDPEVGITTFTRDAVGNKATSQVGTSLATQYTYDGLSRLTDVDYPGNTKDTHFEYDDNSNLALSNKGDMTWTYQYDDNDNLKNETLTAAGNFQKIFSLSYDYDNLDAVSQLTYPNGIIVTYAPDAFGRATQASGYADAIGYHANNAIDQITFANGVTTQQDLNDLQLIESIQVSDGTSGDIVDLQYAYDPNRNIETVTDAVIPGNSLTLDYDNNNRLRNAAGVWGNGTLTYSTHGDLLSKFIGQDQRLAYTYHPATPQKLIQVNNYSDSAITVIDYDTYGNVLNNQFLEFAYDDASNLVSAGLDLTQNIDIAYQYDAKNYRVLEEKEGKQRFSIYNRAGNLLYESDLAKSEGIAYVFVGKTLIAKAISTNALPCSTSLDLNNTTISNSQSYRVCGTATIGPDVIIDASGALEITASDGISLIPAVYSATGSKLNLNIDPSLELNPAAAKVFYHSDALGSIVATTDEDKVVQWREAYRPFGSRIDETVSTEDNKPFYTGKSHDEVTGLSYFGARHYDPMFGRFMGMDAAGVDPNDYHSFNRYAYANNNPYKYIDPDGNIAKIVADFALNVTINVATTGSPDFTAAAIDTATNVVNPLATLNKIKKVGGLIKKASGRSVTKKTTESGIGVTRHSVQQKINRQVRSADELDAIKNPLDVGPVKVDKLGRPSQRFVGRKAEVARNPETGDIVSVNPTSTKKAERLLRRNENQ